MLILNDKLDGVEFLKSVNGRGIISLKFLIIHTNSYWSFEECTDIYLDGDGSKRSTHVLIGQNGQIRQFVEFNRKSWHIGASYYQGHFGLNGCSIGIILEGTGDVSDAQISILDEIVPEIVNVYNLRDVVTDSEVSLINPAESDFPINRYKVYVDFRNADSGGRYSVNTSMPLPLREGPDDSAEIVTEIATATEVKLLRIRDSWRFVQQDENMGWVREEYIRRL